MHVSTTLLVFYKYMISIRNDDNNLFSKYGKNAWYIDNFMALMAAANKEAIEPSVLVGNLK